MIEEQVEDNEGMEVAIEGVSLPHITEEIRKKLEGLEELSNLVINSCKLSSLANFPKLPSLNRLELINNGITGAELVHLKHLKSLQSLSLCENEIKEFDDLKPLVGIEDLVQLDLTDCPIAKDPEYRARIFEMFGSLEVLDNKDADGRTFSYDSEENGEEGSRNASEENGEEGDEEEDSEVEDEAEEDEEEEGEEDEEDEEEEEESESDKPKKKANNDKKHKK